MALKSQVIVAASLALVLWSVPARAASVHEVVSAMDAAISLSPDFQTASEQFKRLGTQSNSP